MRHKDNRGLSFLGDSLAGDSPGRLPPLKEFRIRRVEATNDSAQGGDFEPFPARILRLTTSYAGKLRPIRPEDCRGPTFRIRDCRKKLLVENIPFRTSPQGADFGSLKSANSRRDPWQVQFDPSDPCGELTRLPNSKTSSLTTADLRGILPDPASRGCCAAAAPLPASGQSGAGTGPKGRVACDDRCWR